MAEAAIAAVGFGASVVSFVGITGQILQGCQFICDYIDEIKGAPKELQQMLLELKNFEAGLRSFQTTLDNAKGCVDVNSLEEQICHALNLAKSAVQDLRALVEKHAHNGKRDWWKNFKVAKKKNVFIKYRERLDKAKLELIFVQLNINTVIGLAHGTSMHQLIQAQTAISMQSPLTVSTTMATQTRDLPEPAADIIHEDESVPLIGNDLAAELGPMTARIVGSSVNIALESFISDTQGKQCPKEMQPEHLGPTYHHRDALDDQKLIRSDGMRVIHQTTQERTYNAWLASITIHSTTTKLQEIAEGDGHRQQDYVESSQTVFKIDIRPHYFVQARFLAVISYQGLGAHPLNSDMRIRCYNIVPANAPIVVACRWGDVAAVRRLFASRQASPFDVVPREYQGASNSLLYEVACIWLAAYTLGELFRKLSYTDIDHMKRMMNRLEIMEYLIDHGLDPGEPVDIPVLWLLFDLLADCDLALIPKVQRIIRLIIERSVQNPFHGPRHSSYRRRGAIDYVTTSSLKDCIESQEIWPMSDLENAVKDLQSPPERYSEILWEKAPALLRDPNGLRLRSYLQSFTYTSQQLVEVCAIILLNSQHYSIETVCFAIEQRLKQCLQAGMDPGEPVTMGMSPNNHTLYSLARGIGASHVLTSALTSTGRTTSEIDTIYDNSKYVILERELTSLRPTSVYRSRYGATPSSVLRAKAMAFDESYQKLFPGEEMECPSLFDIFKPRGFSRFRITTLSNEEMEELFNECVITDRMEDDYVFIMLASTTVQAKIWEELKPFE